MQVAVAFLLIGIVVGVIAGVGYVALGTHYMSKDGDEER